MVAGRVELVGHDQHAARAGVDAQLTALAFFFFYNHALHKDSPEKKPPGQKKEKPAHGPDSRRFGGD
jgi:hypothetical protein